MKIVRMNSLNSDSKLAAFFDAETDEGIIIKGFHLAKGQKGLFISSPSDKGKDGKYYDRVLLPPNIKSSLEKDAIDEYNKSRG